MTWKVTWAEHLAQQAAYQRKLRREGRAPKHKNRLPTGKPPGRPVPPSRLGDGPMTPAHIIDAEPVPPPGQVRYRVGVHCWLIDGSKRWWLCEVVSRTPKPRQTITLRPATGWDAERLTEWPYGELLEFPVHSDHGLFTRLRPLRYRQP